MTTPRQVLQIAASRIGYYAPSDPLPGSEAGRYVADLWASYSSAAQARADGCYNWESGASWLKGPSNEIWWCCLFVSMCYHMAGGRNMPGIPNYNCDNLKSKARAYVLNNKRNAQPGDFILYDWGGDGSCDHIGICELNLGNTGVQCIEGNTSGSNGGSQSAGNGVWRRVRSWSYVNCVIRPVYTGEEDMPLTDNDVQKVWNYGGSYNALNAIYQNIQNLADKISIDVPVFAKSGKMQRFYNPSSGEHRWVSNENEIANLIRLGWTDEGLGFVIPFDKKPVYMLMNRYSTDVLLTSDYNEADTLNDRDWDCLGVVGLDYGEENGVPVFRIYDGYNHLFTVSENEKDELIKAGYKYEGIAFYSAKSA